MNDNGREAPLPAKQSARTAREKRLAQALRENLKRRKAAATAVKPAPAAKQTPK